MIDPRRGHPVLRTTKLVEGTCMRQVRKAPTAGSVVDIDSFGGADLLVATEDGELTLTTEDAPVLHTKSETQVTGVACIFESISLVFSQKSNGRKSAAVYETPRLQQVPGLTLHEVHGCVALDRAKQIAAVYTPAAIRVLKFDLLANPKAKVVKTIELRGISTGCASEGKQSALLVATQTEYQLVSLKRDTVSPLFPILNGLRPLMTSMGEDFLVVQGTAAEEPAMGLFVDTNGDVARQGVVIQWPKYPSSLAACTNHIFSVVDGVLQVHYVDESSAQVQELRAPDFLSLPPTSEPQIEVVRVRKLSFPVKDVSQDLLDRLGDASVAEVDAPVAFLLSTGEIHTWFPEPRLLKMEAGIRANEMKSIEPDPRYTGSEQGIAELKYLSMYLCLHLLNEDEPKDALRAWRNGAQLDSDLVLYCFGFSTEFPANLFPGLAGLVEAVRAKTGPPKNEAMSVFVRPYLRTSVKRLRSNPSTAYTTCKTLELLLAQLIMSDADARTSHEMTRLLCEKELKSRQEILAWLSENKHYDELEHYYRLSQKPDELIELWMSIICDAGSSNEQVQSAAANIRDTILQETRPGRQAARNNNIKPADIWRVSIDLLQNKKVDNATAISVFTSPQFEDLFDPADILRVLKDETDSGEPWKNYLQQLVHSKGMFKDDFVTVLIHDIIKQYPDGKSAVRASYERFAELKWPKPKYQTWLGLELTDRRRAEAVQTKQLPSYPQELLGLQSELWGLMTAQLDWMQLMDIFDTQLTDFKLERALVYFNLGLHQQCIDLFNEISDFRSLIDYPAAITDASTRRDLAQLALRSLLHSEKPRVMDQVLREFLNANTESLELDAVLALVPNDMPLQVAANFLSSKFQALHMKEREKHVLYAVAKATSESITKRRVFE